MTPLHVKETKDLLNGAIAPITASVGERWTKAAQPRFSLTAAIERRIELTAELHALDAAIKKAEYCGLSPYKGRIQKSGSGAKILAALVLAGGPLGFREIHARVGGNPHSFHVQCIRMVERGLLIRCSRGVYSLPPAAK